MRRTKTKNKYGILFVLLCAVFFSGCTLELPTPESLITAPESNQELMQQKQMISEFLGKEERMIVPEENAIGTAYQYINLDADREKEIVVFYADKESDFMLGFMVLDQQDGVWKQLYKARAYGTDIHYFSVQDLDLDNTPEFLLGVRTGYGAQKELYVYHLTESGLSEITKDERIAYDSIVLAEPMDGKVRLVTACTDTTAMVGSSNITIYEYRDRKINPIYNNVFDGFCSDMRFDKVQKDTEGIYLAMRYNHYMNVLLLTEMESDYTVVVEQSIPYDYDGMDGITLFNDVNNDGILEMNSLRSPENNFSGKTYAEYMQIWLQWDGHDSYNAVSAVLPDHANGYAFLLPIEWLDTVYYDFDTKNEIAWTEFYYENENGHLETVFAFAAVDRLIWDGIADDMEDTVVVLGNHPTMNKVYIADIKTDAFNGFSIDAGKLSSCLQIERGETP